MSEERFSENIRALSSNVICGMITGALVVHLGTFIFYYPYGPPKTVDVQYTAALSALGSGIFAFAASTIAWYHLSKKEKSDDPE